MGFQDRGRRRSTGRGSASGGRGRTPSASLSSGSRGYSSQPGSRRPSSSAPGHRRRGSRKKSFFGRLGDFFSSHALALLITAGALILAAGLAVVAIFVVVPAIKEAGAPAEPAYVEPVSTPVPTPEPTPTPVPEEPTVSIGIILGVEDKDIMDGFGEYAQQLISSDSGLDKYYIYTAGEDPGQQIQDTRSIINKGCNVLVAVGLEADTADIVAGLCERAGIIVVGAESKTPGRFAAEIKSADAWYGGYSSGVQTAMAGGGRLALISDEKKSDFSLGIKNMLTEISVTPEDEIYYGPMTKAGLTKAVDKAFKKKPEVMLVRGSRAVDFLTRAAKADAIPGALVTRATAGIIKTWHQLKNEGLVTVEAVVPEEGDTKTEPVAEVRAFAPDSMLYAYAGLDGTMVGKAACRFAFRLATGSALIDENTVYTVASEDMITNDNLAEYYEIYKDTADDKNIPGKVDIDAIDALFTAAPQPTGEDAAETETEDGV